tara:strand:+ start:189 stop:1367 length:1179 start_codon:yes stop_codon:yes gene_type:complete
MAKSVYLNVSARYHHEPPLKFKLNFSNPVYWWCAVPDSHTLVSLLNSKNLYESFINDLKNNNGLLLIDLSQDPVHIKQVENLFLKDGNLNIFNENKIDLKRIVVLTPSPDELYFDEATDNFSTYIYPKKVIRPYKHIFFNSLFRHTKLAYFNNKNIKSFKKQPTKHFLCNSYRDAIPRQIANSLFHKYDLYDKNLISHNRFIQNDPLTDLQKFKKVKNIFRHNNTFDVISFLKHGFKKHFLDTPETKSHATYSYAWHDKLSSKVCFEVVIETCVSQNKRFLTEKFLKAILSKNIFLLIGNPHSLEWLKSLGFKTFSDIIDESYDFEEVFYKRLLMVFEEIKRLCSYDVPVLYDKILKINDIVEHNYNHFLNNTWDFSLISNIQTYMDNINDR